MPRKHNHQHRAAHRRFLKTDAAQYVSITAAAQLVRVSRPTIYAWIDAAKIQHTHIAGRLVIVRASLIEHDALRKSSSPRS